MPPHLLSVKDIVAQTGIPKSSVLYDIVNGKLKAHKLSGRTGSYTITTDDYNDWLAGRGWVDPQE